MTAQCLLVFAVSSASLLPMMLWPASTMLKKDSWMLAWCSKNSQQQYETNSGQLEILLHCTDCVYSSKINNYFLHRRLYVIYFKRKNIQPLSAFIRQC